MKLLSADEVRDIIKQNDELKKYSEKLTSLNSKLQKDLEQATDKLKHLEEIAKFSNNPIAVGSNEEELCKLEIHARCFGCCGCSGCSACLVSVMVWVPLWNCLVSALLLRFLSSSCKAVTLAT